MKKSTRLYTLFVIILISTLAAGCQADKDTGTENQPADVDLLESRAGEVYELGDRISIGNSILVVLGWDIFPGGEVLPPEEGYKHLAVDVMLANQGKDPFDFSPSWFMTLKDPSGNIYNMNGISGRVSGSDSPDAELVPGEIIRGMVGFQVPEDQAEFVLVFEPDQDDLGEISVNLGSIPGFNSPPADLGLKLQQEVFHTGESVELLGLYIEVIEVTYPADDEITRPQEGYKSLVVTLQVENQGDGTLYFTGSDQIYLKDSTGQKYSDDSLALPTGSDDHVIGSLEPGESIRGRMGFMVPNDGDGFILVFDRDLFDFGKVLISLD